MKNKILSTIAVSLVLLFTSVSFADTIESTSTSGAASSADSQNLNSQGQNQSATTDLNDIGNIKDSFNSQGMRGFTIPGETHNAPVINYYGKPLPSEGFQPIEQLIMYGGCFSEGALESMLKGVEKASAEFKISNKNINAGPTDDKGTRWIKVIVQVEKVEGVQLIGYVTARSENNNTTMVEVMAKAALTALQNGCNVIHFTGQGAVRDTWATGWGVGFNHTTAYIADQQDRSNVATGGLGYSSAKAGMRDKPWLQGFGLVDPNMQFPESK